MTTAHEEVVSTIANEVAGTRDNQSLSILPSGNAIFLTVVECKP